MIDKNTKQYWFNELEQSALFLEKLYRNELWSDELEFQVEKAIFMGFYAVRKLSESGLLLNSIKSINWDVMAYPKLESGENDKWINNYHLFNGRLKQLTLIPLSNQFIHSKLFSPLVPVGTRCVGLYFVSDKEMNKELYYIQLVNIISVFFSVAKGKNVKLKTDVVEDEITVCNLYKYIT